MQIIKRVYSDYKKTLQEDIIEKIIKRDCKQRLYKQVIKIVYRDYKKYIIKRDCKQIIQTDYKRSL